MNDCSVEIQKRINNAKFKMSKLSATIFDNRGMFTRFKVIMFKQNVLEILLYACATWTMKGKDYDNLRQFHKTSLHRITRRWKSSDDPKRKRLVSYKELLRVTGCESVETLVRRRRLTFAGHLVRMGDERLPKNLFLGEIKTNKQRTRTNGGHALQRTWGCSESILSSG